MYPHQAGIGRFVGTGGTLPGYLGHLNGRTVTVAEVSEQGSNFSHAKWTCYDTGLRSAAIVRWPGVVDRGRVSSALVQYVGVLPTLLEAAGGVPDRHGFDGRIFLAVLTGEAEAHHDYVFGVQTSKGIYPGPEAYGIRTVRDDQFRLIWNVN